MAISVQTVSVVPAVIVAFELEEFCSSSVRTRQAQGEHRGFTAAVGEAHRLRRRHHAPEALGSIRFRRSGGCKMRTAGHGLRNYLNNFRMCMALNQCAERHHEIDV